MEQNYQDGANNKFTYSVCTFAVWYPTITMWLFLYSTPNSGQKTAGGGGKSHINVRCQYFISEEKLLLVLVV